MGFFDFFRKQKNEERFILCIDGGGMRGIIPVIVLQRLEKHLRDAGFENTIQSCFDLIAGTSTGGLISLALSCPSKLESKEYPNGRQVSLENLEKQYCESGKEVFPPSVTDLFGLGKAVRSVAFNKYSQDGIEGLLKNWFEENTMSQATVPTLITAYDISHGCEYLITSYNTGDFPVWAAGRATSAAPTFYAPFEKEISGKKCLLADGGVIANNPALFAYSEAKKLYPDCKTFHILSLGTANDIHTTDVNRTEGLINWIDQVYPMYSTAQRRTADLIMEESGIADYIRIDGQMDKVVKMDDIRPSSIEKLRNYGNFLADRYNAKLKETAEKLIEIRKFNR